MHCYLIKTTYFFKYLKKYIIFCIITLYTIVTKKITKVGYVLRFYYALVDGIIYMSLQRSNRQCSASVCEIRTSNLNSHCQFSASVRKAYIFKMRVFFDITIGGVAAGRIVFEVSSRISLYIWYY